MEGIKTLQQAITYFADAENCRKFMLFHALARWEGEVSLLSVREGDLAGEGEGLPLLWGPS